ncbi:hypothetical protein E5288_WYG014145 [Bos mutus]|uniref:Condensin-2 complex subunit H2 n=1 Tax=Bos mutus TaxID=72004 RepID=A0A6B0R2A4_9CETA|nr:hypothetical protein [Bos mutus]
MHSGQRSPLRPQPLRSRSSLKSPLRERKEALEPASWLKETPDPWQGLEPFESLDSERCRKGRPYSVPPAWRRCQDRSERGRVASSCRTFTSTRPHAGSRRPWRKGPSFAAMEVLYWKHDSVEDLGAADDFLEPEEYTEPKAAEPGEKAEREAAATPVSLRWEELVQKNVELFVTTWKQELVQETELKQHVRDWEDTIQTLLQEQEEHMPFDIHTCGDQVSRFSQLNQWRPFAKLVAGQAAFEVCRFVLASL